MKRILLVYDVDGWAYHRRAVDLMRHAPYQYDVTAVAEGQYLATRFEEQERPDAILWFGWFACPLNIGTRTVCLLASDGCRYDPWPCRVSGGRCDHQQDYWPAVCASRLRNRNRAARVFPQFDGIIALNQQLAAFAGRFNHEAVCIPTGIDGETFRPQSKISTNARDKLRVGWCGQVKQLGEPSLKGFGWVFEPVRRRCAHFCTFEVNTRNYKNALDVSEMVAWYNSVDGFLCTSIGEGIPTTAMEALSCGRPVVSTEVGDMPNLVQDGQTGFLTGKYDHAKSAAKVIDKTCLTLRQLHEDRQLVSHMGQQARVIMQQSRNWTTLASQWFMVIAGD